MEHIVTDEEYKSSSQSYVLMFDSRDILIEKKKQKKKKRFKIIILTSHGELLLNGETDRVNALYKSTS